MPLFNSTSTSRNNNSNSNKSKYAFSQLTAQSSSVSYRQQEVNSFHKPLPAPVAIYSNPFNDNNSDSNSQGLRTPSPSHSATNPLLEGASPISSTFERMPPSSSNGGNARSGGNSSAIAGGDGRQPSASRRYGPSASAATANPRVPLLGQQDNNRQALGQDPTGWGTNMSVDPEADDYLHNPDPARDRKNDRGSIFTSRGLVNVGCLFIMLLALFLLFAGYPIISFYTDNTLTTNGAFNLGGINSTGQIPLIANFLTPIDPDTPSDKYTITGYDGETYNLAFSDEFNKDGRTFYPGDDPYWTGVDLHYWPTGDFEWYDPSAITTKDGNLVITISQEPIHDLNFKSGMLQSWNQMCFQYSMYLEVSVSLPGTNTIGGFWPGIWTMGNLGRPGYGATTEGTWPYTYDSCDIGTLANQTNAAGTGPEEALTGNTDGTVISYLPGQRLSACTCKGEDHPGPDVSYGRGVPEIDALEGQIDIVAQRGQLSQSCQVAPFDYKYEFVNTTAACTQYDTSITTFNAYKGGTYQEAVSSVTYIDADHYAGTAREFGVHGFEMYSNPNDRSAGHITWFADGKKSWTMSPTAVPARSEMGIGQRLISEEPMAMVINLGMSNNFEPVDFVNLVFPNTLLVDYIRVYQRSDGKMGCDPADRPTADYIANHANAYADANLTTWSAAGYTMPKNSLKDTC